MTNNAMLTTYSEVQIKQSDLTLKYKMYANTIVTSSPLAVMSITS